MTNADILSRTVRGMAGCLCISLLSIPASLADSRSDGTAVIVAVDHDVYSASEIDLLEEQVRSIAQAELKRFDYGIRNDEVWVAFDDAEKEAASIDEVEKHFALDRSYVIRKSATKVIRITYSADIRKAFSPERLQRDAQALDTLARSLRTPLPGVVIQSAPDGAIVRADDSSFGDLMHKIVGPALVVTPLSNTSWHVALNLSALPGVAPAEKIERQGETESALRMYLGDPLDVQVANWEDGVAIRIPDPEKHGPYLTTLRQVFVESAGFVASESDGVVLHIISTNSSSADTTDQSNGLLAPKPLWSAGKQLDELTNPPVEIKRVGDAISFRAEDPSHNAERAEVIRQGLANRTDIVVTTLPDQSLFIKLAPGAHLVSVKAVSSEQLPDAIRARAKGLNLRVRHVLAIGAEMARVEFGTQSEADTFRNALAEPFGLTFQLVDESHSDAMPAAGEERKPMPNGGFVWLKPAILMSGTMVADARLSSDKFTNDPVIEFRLTDEGSLRFGAVTAANVGRRFAIVLDGAVLTAPVIRSPIRGGEGIINGAFDAATAKSLAQRILTYRDDVPLRVADASAKDGPQRVPR